MQLQRCPASAGSGVPASMLSRKASRRWPGAWPALGRVVVGMAYSNRLCQARDRVWVPMPCHKPRGRQGGSRRRSEDAPVWRPSRLLNKGVLWNGIKGTRAIPQI